MRRWQKQTAAFFNDLGEVVEMAKRGDARRNGEKYGRRNRETLRLFYVEGYKNGLRDGWIRGAIVGAVVAAGIAALATVSVWRGGWFC